MATEKHVSPNPHGIRKEEHAEPQQKAIIESAELEICRILHGLGFPFSLKEVMLEKFRALQAALRPGTKYRIPEKLVPITMYFVLRLQNFSFREQDLLELSNISPKEFAAFKLQIITYLEGYA